MCLARWRVPKDGNSCYELGSWILVPILSVLAIDLTNWFVISRVKGFVAVLPGQARSMLVDRMKACMHLETGTAVACVVYIPWMNKMI